MYLGYYPADDSDKEIYEVTTTNTEWQIPNYNPDEMSWALSFRTEIYYLFIPNDTLLPAFRIDIDTNDFDKYIILDDDELFCQVERGTYDSTTQTWSWEEINEFSFVDATVGDTFFYRAKLTSFTSGTWDMSLYGIDSSLNVDAYERVEENGNYYVYVNGVKTYEMDSSGTTVAINDNNNVCLGTFLSYNDGYIAVNIDENTFKTDGTLYVYDTDDYVQVTSGEFNEYDTYYRKGYLELDAINFRIENTYKLYDYGYGDQNYFNNQDNDVTNDSTITSNAQVIKTANTSIAFSQAGTLYLYFALEYNEALAQVTYAHLGGSYTQDTALYGEQTLTVYSLEFEKQ